MLRNYIKTALRYMARYRQYTLINIAGLSVSIGVFILIATYVRNEYGYDRFHSKADRIYRLWQDEMYNGENFINTVTPLSAGEVISATYPEVEKACRVLAAQPIVKNGNNSFTETVRLVDSTFFQVFDFKLLKGNANNPFPNPNSLLLTEETALKYFGNEDPIGKPLEIGLGRDSVLFTVAGIVQKAPSGSSIKFNVLASCTHTKRMFSPRSYASWGNVQTETYFLLRNGVSGAQLEAKFPALIKEYLKDSNYEDGGFKFHLQPLTSIHLDNSLPGGNEPVTDPKYPVILSTIGLLLLVVASINFIILSIGHSVARFREVGVRKVLGADKKQLVVQFWGESLLITLFAVFIGIALAILFFPQYKTLLGIDLTFKSDLQFVLICVAIVIFIAVLAGIYPAMILARYNPVTALKNVAVRGKRKWLQSTLVVAQLVVSTALIVSTITIRKQLTYLNTKDLGYSRDKLVVIESHKREQEGAAIIQRLKNELSRYPQFSDHTASLYSFAQTSWIELGFTNENKIYKGFQYNAIEPGFVEMMGLKMAQGRSFIAGNTSDKTEGAIVNETFVKEFGIKDPVGQKLPGPFNYHIVGVVKDFNYMSLHSPVRPLVLTINRDSMRSSENISFAEPPHPRLTVRIKGDVVTAISQLEQFWKVAVPGREFDFNFVDEALEQFYKQERRTASIAAITSVLSVFIACLGLFGLATLTVTRRTKEIGIRKVLGASSGLIVTILSSDIVKLVCIAALITVPITYFYLNSWLTNFAYHITIGWEVFALGFFITLVIALVTVCTQTIRAAIANPVSSLRTE
jgi:putative ABC transport system permease protein